MSNVRPSKCPPEHPANTLGDFQCETLRVFRAFSVPVPNRLRSLLSA